MLKEWAAEDNEQFLEDVIRDYEYGSVIRNFERCLYSWSFIASQERIRVKDCVTQLSEHMRISKRRTIELLHGMELDGYLEGIWLPERAVQPPEKGFSMPRRKYLIASAAFSFIIETFLDFEREMKVLRREKKAPTLKVLITIFDYVWEDAWGEPYDTPKEFHNQLTKVLKISESTLERSIHALLGLGLIRKNSHGRRFECTEKGKELVNRLAAVYLVKAAEEVRAIVEQDDSCWEGDTETEGEDIILARKDGGFLMDGKPLGCPGCSNSKALEVLNSKVVAVQFDTEYLSTTPALGADPSLTELRKWIATRDAYRVEVKRMKSEYHCVCRSCGHEWAFKAVSVSRRPAGLVPQ